MISLARIRNKIQNRWKPGKRRLDGQNRMDSCGTLSAGRRGISSGRTAAGDGLREAVQEEEEEIRIVSSRKKE